MNLSRLLARLIEAREAKYKDTKLAIYDLVDPNAVVIVTRFSEDCSLKGFLNYGREHFDLDTVAKVQASLYAKPPETPGKGNGEG